MLKSEPEVTSALLTMAAAMSGGDVAPEEVFKELKPGIYDTNVYPGYKFLREHGYDQAPVNLSIPAYGVCDSVGNVLAKCPELNDESRTFIVTVFPVYKDEQPAQGGWRWCKWGDYIGSQQITCDYLKDEPLISKVYCYNIYEKDPKKYTFAVKIRSANRPTATRVIKVKAKDCWDAWFSAVPDAGWNVDRSVLPVEV